MELNSVAFKMENNMEITTKRMATIRISLNKSNHYYLFHLSSKKTVRRLFIEVPCIIYVKNYLECEFQKFMLE